MSIDPNSPPNDAGQQPTAEVSEPTNQGQAPQALPADVLNGFQARINEVTQQVYSLREVNQQKDAQISELLAALAAGRQSQSEPVEVDPEQRRAVEAVVSPLQKQLQEMQNMLLQSQLQQVTAGLDPEVATLANQLMANWRSSGKQGWVPQDAVVYATGVVTTKRMQNARTQQAQQQNFNAGARDLVTSHRMPTSVPQPAASGGTVDPDSMSIDEQINYWAQALDGKTF